MKIGLLALQGAFLDHQKILQSMQIQTTQVRLPEHLSDLDGLIIPGGESTTIGKLSVDFGLLEPLKDFGSQKPIWGTCAGAIFLSKDIHRNQPLLRLMDITVARNAFGRQVDSFEIDLDIPLLSALDEENPPFRAVFIRAPLIETVGEGVEILSTLPSGEIIAATQDHLLATSFHPEMTSDDRFHKYFIQMINDRS